MNCPTCRNIVASNAYNCPNCGHKFRSTPTNLFFKIVLGLLALLVVTPILLFVVLGSLVGGVHYSLKGEEVPVPNIVGKNFNESEKELNQLGLKVKPRAFRFSKDKSNTVLEQLPEAGENVRTGQTVLVVVSDSTLEETPK